MTALRRLHQRGYSQTLLGVLILALYLFPVYWMLATSLKSARDIFATPPILVPFPPVLESYIEVVINNPALHRSVLNSVIISVGAVIFLMVRVPPMCAVTSDFSGPSILQSPGNWPRHSPRDQILITSSAARGAGLS